MEKYKLEVTRRYIVKRTYWSKIIVLTLSIFLLNSHLSSAQTNLFNDLTSDYWAYKEIRYLSAKEVIKGYKDSTFRPTQHINRKQAAIMLSRALDLDMESEGTSKIKDIIPSTFGFDEMNAVIDKGLFHTYDQKFLPDDLFTRQDMAKALSVAFEYEGSGASTFSDVPYDHSYYKYIDGIASHNITDGYTDGTYKPENPVTRAQFSAFLARIFMNPLSYEVRKNGEVIYSVRDSEKAVQLALSVEGATVHPADNTLNTYASVSTSSDNVLGNGVLIYNGDEITDYTTLSKDFFKPYLAYKNNGQYTDKMFDSFIILGRSYPYGELTESKKNHANYGDWNWYLKRTLVEGGAVQLLDSAVKEIPIVEQTNVFLTIPYPKKYENILDIEGNLIENNLNSRFEMVKWYIDESLERLEDYSYDSINLKGFYWLNETVTNKEDEELLEMVSKYVKAKNLSFIYSPHALSTNFDYWKWYGFDQAFLQSNAHKMKFSDHEVRTLIHKAFLRAQTRNSSLNLEIENHSDNTIYQGLDNFRTYLEIAKLYNLQGKSFIMYQGTEMINRLATFDTPHHQKMYDELYEFLQGNSP
jgi:hypothetical protein